jgi:hypothetical protein
VPQVSESFVSNPTAQLTSIIRCTSQPDDLDVVSLPRTPRYTEGLLDLVDSKTLWTDYGIDDDIIVGSLHTHWRVHSQLHFCNEFTAIHVRFPAW